MTALEVLQKARVLLVERGWTQRAYARVGGLAKCLATNPEATCFCALGALELASGGDTPAESRAIDALEDNGANGGVAHFNDDNGRTLDEVLALFDRAIASLESR